MSALGDVLGTVVRNAAPQWVLDGGCGECDHGTLIYPKFASVLPLYVRDALLHAMGEVAWCGCPFGQNRRLYAERTYGRIQFRESGGDGIYVSAIALAVLRAQVADWQTQQDEDSVVILPVEDDVVLAF